jgi:hypothetical protein
MSAYIWISVPAPISFMGTTLREKPIFLKQSMCAALLNPTEEAKTGR